MKRPVGLVVAVVILIASAAFGGIAIEEKDLSKMEVVGDQLFLHKQGGRIAAPDGKYFLRDNSFIIIVNGRIDKANSSALRGHPDIAAEVGRGGQTSPGLQNQGASRSVTPQAETPGGPLGRRQAQ